MRRYSKYDAAAFGVFVSQPSAVPPPDPMRWKALIVIAISQLMVVLDASIVNIALPAMQEDLG
ncbi:MAG: hypothetical protein Q7K25_07350, partial [Actinomycetota bacterium]|nr:hypothetical protein [Actinomycetota bacterium]